MVAMLEDGKMILIVHTCQRTQQVPSISADSGWLVMHQPCVYADPYHVIRALAEPALDRRSGWLVVRPLPPALYQPADLRSKYR